MQRVDGWPDDLSVATPTARVVVNGQAREVQSLSIQSDLDSAMPTQVAAGGGVVATTGDATLASGDPVVSKPVNPWAGSMAPWVSEVTVEAGYNGANAKLLTGTLDSMSGNATDRGVRVSMIDGVDRLNRPITMEPLSHWLPALTSGGANRRVGLWPQYITDRILRHCGFYSTPPLVGQTIFAAPLMGSVIPERGEITDAWLYTTSFQTTPWGLAFSRGDFDATPDLTWNNGRITSPMQVTFNRQMYAFGATRNAAINIHWGSTKLQASASADGTVHATQKVNGQYHRVAALGPSQSEATDTFTIRWHPNGDVEVMAASGATATGHRTLPSVVSTSSPTRVQVVTARETEADRTNLIGGIQISFSSSDVHNFERNAFLAIPALRWTLEAFPAVIDRNCATLLKEQAEAELAAMWIDENGHFRWVNRYQLVESTPQGTLTSTGDLIDLSWEVAAKSVYSRAEIHGKQATQTIRPWANILLSQGGGSSLETGDEDALFIEPPSDEDWFMVEDPQRPTSANADRMRRGHGSYRGGSIAQDGNPDRWAVASEVPQAWAQLGVQKWLLTTTANSTQIQTFEPSAPDGPNDDQFGRYRDARLPIIRGKGRTKWDDITFTGNQFGPSSAPALSHDVGPWVQDPDELQMLADWLAEQVTKPDVVLRDVPIIPDPRIQRGDLFWLEDTTAYDVRLKVVVMGSKLDLEASDDSLSMSHTITCRVIEAQRNGVTLAEHDAIWTGQTLGAQDAYWSGRTLAEHDADPLAH